MNFFKRFLGINIEGKTITVRQIEQGLRKIGYSRSEALQVVCDLKKIIHETA